MSLWIIQPVGQLGNRLATFAHLIAFGIETGRPVYNHGMRRYAESFENLADNFLCRYPKRSGFTAFRTPALEKRLANIGRFLLRKHFLSSTLKAFEYISLGLDEEYDLSQHRQLKSNQRHSGIFPSLLALDGWMFRDYEALNRHRDTVIKFLAHHPEVRSRVDAWLSTIKQPDRPLVGIHVRLGDIVIKYPQHLFDLDHYVALARRMQELLHPARPRFVFCSNEPLPTNMFDGLDATSGLGSIAEDQYTLSRCDYILGPLSTFSSWASFSGKVPVCLLSSQYLPKSLSEFQVCEFP